MPITLLGWCFYARVGRPRLVDGERQDGGAFFLVTIKLFVLLLLLK
jgi:hypothetical protein